MEISAELFTGIVSALGAVAAAAVAGLSVNLGWRSSVLKDIQVFERLYPLVDSGREELELELFRRKIFRKMEKGTSHADTNLRRFASYEILYVVVWLGMHSATGFPSDASGWWCEAVVMVLAGIVYTFACFVLQFVPATDKNPLYRQERLNREMESIMEKVASTIEVEHLNDGWISNYRLYESSMRSKWGFRPSCEAEREHRHAESEADSGEYRVNGEENRQEYRNGV